MAPSPRPVPAWVTRTLGWPSGRGVRVGIIASGYNHDLPDPRVEAGVSFVDPSDDLEALRTSDDHDRIGHGTACAHLVWRIAPDARVVPIRIYGDGLESSPLTLALALKWAVDARLDVVCVAGACTLPGTMRPLYHPCEAGRRKGMIFVAGAISERKDIYPAVFEPVIGVLEGTFDSPYEFHFQPDAPYEVRAWNQGEFIRPDGSHQPKYGPDYAAAVVAGIVALLRERYPGASIEHIRELLQRFSAPAGG
jgi:subtilisin